MGKVFRSDDLHKLTDADLTYLNHIPMISIVDFRTESEIEQAPDKLPASAKRYSYPINPGNLASSSMEQVFALSPLQMDSAMMDMNRLFSIDSVCVNRYIAFFKLLQDDAKSPLMFHCSAGKDRTGMAAALFLFSLGVDKETILQDYLSSNIYLGDKYAPYLVKYPNLKPLFEVKREFIEAGLDQIEKDHGSIESYLINVLNVDIQRMKSLYLY